MFRSFCSIRELSEEGVNKKHRRSLARDAFPIEVDVPGAWARKEGGQIGFLCFHIIP